jgi:hypothetical protein
MIKNKKGFTLTELLVVIAIRWSCPSRNWQNEFDYVVGMFEIN